MKTIFARTALTALLLCGSASAVLIGGTGAAYAEEHVSKGVVKPLNDAIKAVQAKDYATANASLTEADTAASSDFDKLKIAQIRAFVAISQKDYAAATTYFEQVVASPAFASLEPKEQQETLRNSMLLSTNAQHWPQVIAAAERLEKFAPLDALTESSLAVAYYNTKDLPKANDAAQKSIDMSKAAGKVPEQAALQIVMSVQASKNDQAGARATLEMLAEEYGSPGDWSKLIDSGFTRGITELDGLYLYRLRFFADADPASDDYASAAAIAQHLGFSAEAVSILQKGAGKTGGTGKAAEVRRQAEAGANADRKALPEIVRAAERAKDGKQELALAEDYWGYGRYSDVVAAGQAALAKGGLKDPSEAHFIIGIGLVAQGQYAQAQTELALVNGSPGRNRAAQLWSEWAKFKAKAAPAH